LAAVAYRILASNTDMCGADKHSVLGIEASFAGTNGGPDGKAYLTVLSATLGAPAARSGIRAGDRITEINGEGLPPGPDGLHLLRHWLDDDRDGVLTLGVERGGAAEHVMVRAVPACSYDVVLMDDNREEAMSQERRVMLTAGLVAWLANDHDLATVVGHEIAHIAAGHTRSDPVISADEAEAEADYLGIYLATRAGYDVSRAADLLKRTAARLTAEGGQVAPSSIALRLQAIEAALDEIRPAGTAGAPPQAFLRALHGWRRHLGSLG
jgi:hypothetical protein